MKQPLSWSRFLPTFVLVAFFLTPFPFSFLTQSMSLSKPPLSLEERQKAGDKRVAGNFVSDLLRSPPHLRLISFSIFFDRDTDPHPSFSFFSSTSSFIPLRPSTEQGFNIHDHGLDISVPKARTGIPVILTQVLSSAQQTSITLDLYDNMRNTHTRRPREAHLEQVPPHHHQGHAPSLGEDHWGVAV